MPSVAISSVMPSWLTSLPSTSRSTSQATMNITTIAQTKARALLRNLPSTPVHCGIHSAKRAIASAANSTIAPCAKLNTPEALKISTKPSATSEYSMPVIRPPITVSRKNPIVLPSSSVGGAEVGLDDLGIAAHLVGRAVADLAAVVEHHHAVGDVHHDAHVVLDQHDGRAELVVDVEDEAAHVLLLLDVHAGHRLVEQQHLGLHRERAAQVDALLQAVGHAAHRRLAVGLDLEEVDDALDELAVADLLALGRPDAQRLQQQVALHAQVAARHDVVEHAHALEQREVLEGARDAHLGHLARVHVLEGAAAEVDLALLRAVDAVDAVEHRALAGAVGTDDGADLVLAHVEADVRQRLHAAEGEADVAHVEDHLAGAARRGRALVGGDGIAGGRQRRLKGVHGGRHHAALRAGTKVFASTIGRSALTRPVRPSSKRTCVSMCCDVRPS